MRKCKRHFPRLIKYSMTIIMRFHKNLNRLRVSHIYYNEGILKKTKYTCMIIHGGC